MMKGWIWTCGLLACALTLFAPAAVEAQSDEDAVREVVDVAYVHGIHIDRDSEAVRAGFHESFVMSVQTADGVRHVSRDQWIEGLDAGVPNPREVEVRFLDIYVVGNTATARLELHIDGEHTFTDVIGLYRFDDGWKMVNKVFQRH